MDLKYISPSKLLFFYGIIGIFINIIICILSTYIKCKTIGNYNIHICNIYKEDNSDGIYLENFYIYFKILSTSINYERIIEVIISFIGAITYFFYLYFFILVIKYLTPVHIIFTSLVYGFLTRILIIIYNSINSNSNPNNNNQNYTIIIFKYIFDFLSNTFTWVGIFIYLEFVELKFCNLNYNLRNNIIQRSFDDVDIMNEDYLENEENDDERETSNCFRHSNFSELAERNNRKES